MRKKSHHNQHGQAAVAADTASVRPSRPSRPERPRFQPYSGPRDVVTGAPLDPRIAAIRQVESEDRVDAHPTPVERRLGWRSEPEDFTARPLRLHTHESETTSPRDGAAADDGKGSLGGQPFTRDMARYLQSALADQRAEQRADDTQWHRSAYGRGRVFAEFTARWGKEQGALAYRVALLRAFDVLEASEIAAQCGGGGKPVSWVYYVARLAPKVSGRRLRERACVSARV